MTTHPFTLRKPLLAFALSAASVLSLPTPSLAASPASFFHVSGFVRLYGFNKNYGAPTKPDQRSSALGEGLNITTDPFLGGFGLGLSVYNANAIETFPAGDKAQETTLMGAKSSLTTVGQAYAQYARDGALIRAGRQIINTPWMGARDSRMIPQTFQGVWASIAPVKGLQLMATRINAFRSRTSDSFTHDNLYYPNGYEGDTLYGTTTVFPKKTVLPEASGTSVVGARYHSGPIHGEAWFYDYTDFARSTYLNGGYAFGKAHDAFAPYVDAQFMHQTGGSMFQKYKATLFGKGGAVDSTLWGLRGGVKFSGNNVSLAYNKLEDHANAFGGGSIVSPYGDHTAMYAAVMTANLLAYGPGDATELAYSRSFLDHQLKLKVAALKFHTTYSGNPHAVYFDATYALNGKLKGLSIRERLAISNGASSAAYRSLVYNRLMLQYRF
ncbi:MAG: OprD family outer membrane porin [Thiomonas arsenitoxydans]|uniref:OprD family outer membrane porin n=1 Tax=Thiomonas arsenitoxydans (strain DSM 22701 / CIP 110005 / 3As) TaxID=426114 RepID=A0A8I1SWR6_THIA3|nr:MULTISPECIES: OprD family outer membrane porin [Thiomonas]MBN8743859.1 OprD family outer membrane porin [Thiomonas arsenitoxydans]ODU98513.1 MAG: hypothetical protein ABT24_01000 [Thiomonas sp. SCN 64-16]